MMIQTSSLYFSSKTKELSAIEKFEIICKRMIGIDKYDSKFALLKGGLNLSVEPEEKAKLIGLFFQNKLNYNETVIKLHHDKHSLNEFLQLLMGITEPSTQRDFLKGFFDLYYVIPEKSDIAFQAFLRENLPISSENVKNWISIHSLVQPIAYFKTL